MAQMTERERTEWAEWARQRAQVQAQAQLNAQHQAQNLQNLQTSGLMVPLNLPSVSSHEMLIRLEMLKLAIDVAKQYKRGWQSTRYGIVAIAEAFAAFVLNQKVEERSDASRETPGFDPSRVE